MPCGRRRTYAGRVPLPRVARTRKGHIWGESWRLGLALLAGLLVWSLIGVDLEDTGLSPRFGPAWFVVDLALGLVAVALLLFRRRWPVAVAVATVLLSGLAATAIGASGLALISMSTRRRWREIALLAVPWMIAGFANERLYPSAGEFLTLTNLIIGALSFAVSVSIGFAIGERRAFVGSLHERALTAEREQSMRVVQAQVAERARIAREMHDVLAHRISLVAMHSGALTFRTDLSQAEVAETAEVVRANANLALTELRAVLGVLRDLPSSTATQLSGPEAPQPTLADLGTLVAEARTAGSRVRLVVDGEVAAVPEHVSRSCFRIVQECLTNARKHAPGMPVDVTVRVAPLVSGGASSNGSTSSAEAASTEAQPAPAGAVTLTVRNTIPFSRPAARAADNAAAPANSRSAATPVGSAPASDAVRNPTGGSGLGLVGITERAVLAGGELTHGRDRRGDFVVAARLPWAS